jgi:AcrR family transcriptional regulator
MTRRSPVRAAAAPARRYESALRRSQHAATRAQIVEAAYVLLQTTPPHELSYALVAEHAAVTQRTVYRHFPEHGELLQAVAHKHLRAFLGEDMRPSADMEVFAGQLARLHATLSANPNAYRVMMAAPTRTEAGAKTFLELMLAEVLARVPRAQRSTVLGVWELIFSPYLWEVLHTHHGVEAPRITHAALVVATLVRDALERDPALFDPARPVPAPFRSKLTRTRRTPKERT